ncbi:MAG: ABC transporter ATP-binding protein [Spirochaetales bacterium]|nr:ABC transporter ATP-binding protein [Spirochaetales bacterium]
MRCEARSLRKDWPSLTVIFDAAVEDGRSLAILGPSGCGKSTALRLVAGLERPDSGRLLLGGSDATDKPARERGLGVVFQDFALFPHLSVVDNVAYGLAVRGLSRADRRSKAEALLARLGLEGFGRREVASLSGGERQRVALARALAIDPAAVLLDEPLSSLDPELRKRLRSELRDLQRREGFTMLAVTHDIEEAFLLGDEVALMDGGRVVQLGAPEALWLAPADAGVARFLGRGTVLPALAFEPAPAGLVHARTALGVLACREPVARDEAARYGVLVAADALVPVPATGSADGSAALRGRVVRADFAGSLTRLELETEGGARFRAELKGRDASPGETLAFAAQPDACLLVPERAGS